MLKTSLIAQKVTEVIAEKELKKGKKKKKSAEEKKDAVTANKDVNAVKKDTEQRIKGPKRYVVFVGNLPVGINKDKVRALNSAKCELDSITKGSDYWQKTVQL